MGDAYRKPSAYRRLMSDEQGVPVFDRSDSAQRISDHRGLRGAPDRSETVAPGAPSVPVSNRQLSRALPAPVPTSFDQRSLPTAVLPLEFRAARPRRSGSPPQFSEAPGIHPGPDGDARSRHRHCESESGSSSRRNDQAALGHVRCPLDGHGRDLTRPWVQRRQVVRGRADRTREVRATWRRHDDWLSLVERPR